MDPQTHENEVKFMTILNESINYVKKEMASNDSSHDWNHISRVMNFAKKITDKTNGILGPRHKLKILLSAIFHDIKDWKYSGSHTASSEATRAFLTKWDADVDIIDEVCYVIDNLSYGHNLGGDSKSFPTAPTATAQLTLSIVQDADRLDALGAMGITRCLTYGAIKNQILYDPSILPRINMTANEYKNGKTTTINHFDEKLFKLKDLMNTSEGRNIAIEKEKIMKDFLTQFYLEWNDGTMGI